MHWVNSDYLVCLVGLVPIRCTVVFDQFKNSSVTTPRQSVMLSQKLLLYHHPNCKGRKDT